GAPLGAIIRKGGLGMPVIVSVIIFIFYYIIDNSGYKMARDGEIPVVLGMWISTFILAPMGLFLTYKANNDSAVFNKDAYANFFRKLLGLRLSRHVARKEVIIYPPNYDTLPERLNALTEECEAYSSKHRLIIPPNPLRIFLRNRPDVAVEEISERMEALLEELGNTKDTVLIGMINEYPILAVSAHTSPFGKRWKNLLSGLCLPLGIILYLRIWRFRRRLYRDMKKIVKNNNDICVRIGVLRDKKLID
ncbi:MAG: LptF/LptG family permease, partial [Bacteroidaceae bacterium]|nr:LptF/LptG family permease [Bacteroidaceae bacterium]